MAPRPARPLPGAPAVPGTLPALLHVLHHDREMDCHVPGMGSRCKHTQQMGTTNVAKQMITISIASSGLSRNATQKLQTKKNDCSNIAVGTIDLGVLLAPSHFSLFSPPSTYNSCSQVLLAFHEAIVSSECPAPFPSSSLSR